MKFRSFSAQEAVRCSSKDSWMVHKFLPQNLTSVVSPFACQNTAIHRTNQNTARYQKQCTRALFLSPYRRNTYGCKNQVIISTAIFGQTVSNQRPELIRRGWLLIPKARHCVHCSRTDFDRDLPHSTFSHLTPENKRTALMYSVCFHPHHPSHRPRMCGTSKLRSGAQALR